MVIPFKGHTIFAFADTHGMYRRLAIPAEADILICAGDACEGFNPADLQDFFAWYTAIPAKLRIFVPGNHDRIFNQEPIRARNLIPGGVLYLENDVVEFDDIKFVPDPEVFADYAFREGIVKEILHSIARQNKGLSISLNGTIVPDSF